MPLSASQRIRGGIVDYVQRNSPFGSVIAMARDSVFVTKIVGDAGLRNAQDLTGQLKSALAGHNTIVIDAGGATSVDITTVQLLLSARRQAVAAGKSLTLAAPPHGALRALLVQIGVLDGSGGCLTPDGDFWAPSTASAKGKAA